MSSYASGKAFALSAEVFRPLRAVEGWLFAAEDPRRLAAIRIGLFSVLALRLATSDHAAVADQPEGLFDPVSLFELLPSMPSSQLGTIVQLLGILTALAAAGGLWPRITFPTAYASALFIGLMLNATGKIIHNDVVLMLALLPLLAAPRTASRAWAVGPRGPRVDGHVVSNPSPAYGWPVRTAMTVIALAYLFVGVQKLRYSGLDWVTTDNLRYVLYASSDSQAEPNQLSLLIADADWLAHAFAAATLAVEIGFIFCLPYERLRWLFVPGVVGLHAGIGLTMHLDYSAQALAVIIVFVNWPVLLESLTAREPSNASLSRERTP